MSDGAPSRVYRVTVRGRFGDLTEQARHYLVSNQAEHEIFNSGYTSEGTFTYDSRIDFFNFRYEVRVIDDEPQAAAETNSLVETEAFLRTMKFGYRDLKVESVEAATARFVEAGGTVLVPPFNIQIGRCVVVADPWGNPLVLLDTSKGLLITDEAGNVIDNKTES